MNSALVSIVVLACIAAAFAVPDKTKWTPLVCRPDGVFAPNDERTVDVEACGENQCNFACQARALGLLNEDGTTSMEIYRDWINKVFPAQYKQVATKHIADCYEKFGKNINLSDPKCEMSKSYGDCTWALVPKMPCKYSGA